MGRTETADEVKNEHIVKLGPDLGSVYHELSGTSAHGCM
jgi:hypothetical protein